MMQRVEMVLFIGILAIGCSSTDEAQVDDSTADVTGTVYANLDEVLGGADLGNWLAMRGKLRSDFDLVCGDTFCDGDFSNFTTIGLDCTASKNTKKMSQCVWTFAGSLEYVSGYSGKVTSDIPVITCTIPVKGLASDFVKALQAAAPNPAIQSVVPGGTKSYYDYVSSCFENVPEKPAPTPTKTQTYKSARDVLGGDDPDNWVPQNYALNAEFEDACGDTYCGGDYNDIAALGFTCAISNAGNVKGCGWSFAGSYTTIGAYGVLTAHTKTWTCALPASGKSATLQAYVNGANEYQTNLPGEAIPPSQALAGCF
ncbi:MAG: hypothetical protein ACRELY_01045 [Polyangiaceae bacterium]